MLEAIAIKLVSVLAGFLFEQALVSGEQIRIEGAPAWYYEEKSPQYIYVFSYMEGGLETVEPLKANLALDIEKRFEDIFDFVIYYEQFLDIKDPAEKELIRQFRRDEDLGLFVRRHMRIANITQQDAQEGGLVRKARPARSFGSATLSKQALLDYQKERVARLQQRISQERAKKGFDALDAAFEDDEMDAVARELEAISP